MKQRLFKIAAIATSVLFTYLCIEMLFFTDSFVQDMGLIPSEATSILGRRVSMFMLCIAMISFLVRNIEPSKIRQSISLSIGVMFLGLASMGTYEFFRGTVNSSIWIAITIETMLGATFLTMLAIDGAFRSGKHSRNRQI